MNPLYSLDNYLMNGINSGVKAWNWTTGRTRAELATTLLVAGVGSWINYYAFQKDWTKVIQGSAGLVLTAPIFHLAFHTIDEEEREHAEEGLKSKEATNFQRGTGIMGYTLAGLTTTTLPTEMNEGAPGGYAISLGLLVMRADYVHRRKDCVRRGIERIKEWRKPIPATI